MKYIIYNNQTYLWTEETEEKIRTICELRINYWDNRFYNDYSLIYKGWNSKEIKNGRAIKHTFKIVKECSFNITQKFSKETSYTVYEFADVEETLAYAIEHYQKSF